MLGIVFFSLLLAWSVYQIAIFVPYYELECQTEWGLEYINTTNQTLVQELYDRCITYYNFKQKESMPNIIIDLNFSLLHNSTDT